jgi:plasmid stability protein
MSLTIELSPELERQLKLEAAREGRAPEEFARAVLEERLTTAQQERGSGLAALMDQWLQEGPDLQEAEGYPEQIEPLRLREVRVE